MFRILDNDYKFKLIGNFYDTISDLYSKFPDTLPPINTRFIPFALLNKKDDDFLIYGTKTNTPLIILKFEKKSYKNVLIWIYFYDDEFRKSFLPVIKEILKSNDVMKVFPVDSRKMLFFKIGNIETTEQDIMKIFPKILYISKSERSRLIDYSLTKKVGNTLLYSNSKRADYIMVKFEQNLENPRQLDIFYRFELNKDKALKTNLRFKLKIIINQIKTIIESNSFHESNHSLKLLKLKLAKGIISEDEFFELNSMNK
ncbi:MAG: hypothetical protein ACTSVY_03820 [Candidatus Helarchaeota archaeon]